MVATVMSILAILALGLLVLFAIRSFGEMLERSPESDLVCRSCKTKSIRASFPAGFTDSIFGLFDCVPYRCEVCSFRFYVRRPAAPARVSTSLR
jgi:hypothetical protein